MTVEQLLKNIPNLPPELVKIYQEEEFQSNQKLSNKFLNFSGVTKLLDETLDKLEIHKDNSSLNYRVMTDKKLADKSEEEFETMMDDITSKFQDLQKKTGIKVVELLKNRREYSEEGTQTDETEIDQNVEDQFVAIRRKLQDVTSEFKRLTQHYASLEDKYGAVKSEMHKCQRYNTSLLGEIQINVESLEMKTKQISNLKEQIKSLELRLVMTKKEMA